MTEDAPVMAVTIRAAIDAVPPRLASDPDLDIDNYAREIATTFHLATRSVSTSIDAQPSRSRPRQHAREQRGAT